MTTPKRPRQRAGPAAGERRPVRRRWRDYRTPSGRRPVEEFIDELSDSDAAAVVAGMEEVRALGLGAARHLDGDIWEVRVDGDRVIYRILFAEEGSRGQILLALDAFNKKTQRTPRATIELAKRRLADWRRRGEQMRIVRGRHPPHR
jgi:phage-related protein